MPQRNVASNFTFEQQRVEINNLAQDFWTQKGDTDTAAPTYLKHDGSNAFTGQTLAVPNAFTINANSGGGTVTISGNLDVTGTTTTVSTANLEVTDKNILIGKGSTSDAQADGAGITIDSDTDITFNFVDAKDALVSSIGLEATTHLKAPHGQFTGSTVPATGQGIEINAPDTNTGQISSYDRGGSAYKELRLKGSSVGIYGGTSNALVGTFNSTGLDVTGSLAINSGTVNTCATFTSSDAGAVVNITDSSARSSIEQNGADLKIIADTDGNYANSQIKFQVDASTKMTLDSSGNLDVEGNLDVAGNIITSDGKIGINEQSPQSLLDIHDSTAANDTPEIRIESFRPTIRFADRSSSQADSEICGDNGLQFRISEESDNDTALIERFRITSNGFIQQKFTSNNSTTAEGLFINNLNNGTGNNASLIFSNDSGERKKAAIALIDTGNYGAGDLVFALDGADSGSLHLTNDEKLRITNAGNVIIAETMAVNKPRIVLSAPDDGTNLRHLFGANLQVNSSGTFTTPTANISGGGWEYLSANSLNAHGEIRYLSAPDTNATSSTPEERFRITSNGHALPGADNTQDLGSTTKRWANVYTADAHFNNIGTGGNEVDGSEGHWTMQEGESDFFLINRRSGKKYKFMLQEVN